MNNLILMIAALLLLTSCCPKAKSPGPAYKAPDWIRGVPSTDGRLCAVGIAGATMVRDDAIEVSDESCKIALAKNIRTFIVSASYDKATSGGRGFYLSDTYVKTTEEVTEAVVRNVEVLDHFYDALGIYSGGQESTYSLCCMPAGSAGR